MKTTLSDSPTRLVKDSFNMNIHNILELHKKESLNFDAPYQRGLVWTNFQKEELISSIIEWIPINALYWNEYNERDPFEVIDGKQRLTTIIDFSNNLFTWKGYFYSELPETYQAIFKAFSIVIHETKYENIEQCETLYDRINFYGTTHERR